MLKKLKGKEYILKWTVGALFGSVKTLNNSKFADDIVIIDRNAEEI